MADGLTVSKQISIELNGERREVAHGATVRDLLESLGIPVTKVAVERNLAIVPKSAYGQTVLRAGDRLEVVHFVGGG